MGAYTVHPHAGGFAVAYTSTAGELIAVSEHCTPASAAAEARRLDYMRRARMAQARAEELARHMRAAAQPRRPVRWFEPDAFA